MGDVVTTERNFDAIYQAKLDGISDEDIMKQFSVGLKEIEQAVIKKTGANLNLVRTPPTFSGIGPKRFKLEPTTVWSFKNRGKWSTHNGNYRGNWSPYIPRNAILRYSQPGDLVLDQFCGGGTTAVEAKLLGRRCIASDISPAAIELAKRNLEFNVEIQEKLDESTVNDVYEPMAEVADARKLHGIKDNSVDLICTHPPYANIIQYSDGLDGDLSFHDVDEFIEDMNEVAAECQRVLKPGGFCAILIGDTRRNKRVVPIGFRTIDAFLQQGFLLKDFVIKRQHNCRTTGFWYTRSVKYNFLLLAQEYLPIFQKPVRMHQNKSPPKKRNNIGLKTISTEKIQQPETLESMTTWVFPAQQADALTDANILHRYGGSNRILEMKTGTSISKHDWSSENDLNLLYLKIQFGGNDAINFLSPDIGAIISDLETMLASGGHLVIRTQDVKNDGLTISPVLKVWKEIREPLKIREIVVVSKEGESTLENASELAITHEYILVYQKD